MTQVLAKLPSQIKNTILIKLSNNESHLQYDIQQNIDCKDAFEWDFDASRIKKTALAQLVSVDFKQSTITLNYEKQQLLNKVEKKQEFDYLYILFQLIEACYELHKINLLGRCLSTSNIEINEKSQIKIYRYGYSHNLLNTDEVIILAPETIFEDKVQISCDIWLIGMIIYEVVFKKQKSSFIYPHQYSQYKIFINNCMQTNTFEDLYDNLVDPNISAILQLLLIFDAESRISSYSAVILFLMELQPKYKAKLVEILRFYENNSQFASINIQSRSEKRDPPKKKLLKNLQSKSLDNLEKSQEMLLHSNRRIFLEKKKEEENIKIKILRYSYQKSVRLFNKIYELQIHHKENLKPENIEFCQNIHFKLYQISFLISLRRQISSLTNKTESLNLDRYLYNKTEEILNLQIQNIKQQSNILFKQELQHILKELEKLKITYQGIKNIYNKILARQLEATLENQIEQLDQDLQKNDLTKKFASEINLRIIIAQNIQLYLNDKHSVNLFFFPMKFYLGLSEITEPEDIERYLQRSPNSLKVYILNLLKNYQNEDQNN
ncbi:unnamed protein product [Paramecium sonneborni]|uniref:Protein kinase domain-containing protein n=1 Tax=Paramecium sonneborni TaxID=65129 RepID=A0A8S1N6Q8_9CILI|nr:unnamed protein product [Paramecium sonneborni]